MQKSTAVTRTTQQEGNVLKKICKGPRAERGPGETDLLSGRHWSCLGQTNLGLCFLPTRSHRFWWLYVLGGLAKCVAQEGTREGCGLCSVSDVTVFSRSSRPSFYKVVLGAHEEDIRGSDVQQLQVNKLFLEPKRADIALLKLARYGFPEVCSQAE